MRHSNLYPRCGFSGGENWHQQRQKTSNRLTCKISLFFWRCSSVDRAFARLVMADGRLPVREQKVAGSSPATASVYGFSSAAERQTGRGLEDRGSSPLFRTNRCDSETGFLIRNSHNANLSFFPMSCFHALLHLTNLGHPIPSAPYRQGLPDPGFFI